MVFCAAGVTQGLPGGAGALGPAPAADRVRQGALLRGREAHRGLGLPREASSCCGPGLSTCSTSVGLRRHPSGGDGPSAGCLGEGRPQARAAGHSRVLTEPRSLPPSLRVCREGELLREDNAEVRQESRLHCDRRRCGRGARSQKGTRHPPRPVPLSSSRSGRALPPPPADRPLLPAVAGQSIPICKSQKHPE